MLAFAWIISSQLFIYLYLFADRNNLDLLCIMESVYMGVFGQRVESRKIPQELFKRGVQVDTVITINIGAPYGNKYTFRGGKSAKVVLFSF